MPSRLCTASLTLGSNILFMLHVTLQTQIILHLFTLLFQQDAVSAAKTADLLQFSCGSSQCASQDSSSYGCLTADHQGGDGLVNRAQKTPRAL